MKTQTILLTLLFLSSASFASDVNYENITGKYLAEGSAFGRTAAFNIILSHDRRISVQKIRSDGIQARICSGPFEIIEKSSWLSNSSSTILQGTLNLCVDQETWAQETVSETFELDIKNANIQDLQSEVGAAVTISSSKYPISVSGTMRKQ